MKSVTYEERKNAMLFRSETGAGKLKDFIGGSSRAAFITDENFRPVWFNLACRSAFPPFEDARVLLDSLLKPEEKPRLEDFFRKETGAASLEFTGPDGKTASAYKRFLSGEGEERFLITVILREERKEPGEYEIIFRDMPCPCLVFAHGSGVIETFNRAFVKLSGLPPEHLEKALLQDVFVHGRDTVESYLSIPEPYSKSFIVQWGAETPDQTVLEITPVPLKKLPGKVLFRFEDVTWLLTSQAEEATLSFQHSFIYKNMTEGRIIWQDGRVLDINAAAARMWGYAPHEIIGKDTASLFSDRSGDEESILGESYFRGIRKDGTEFDGKRVTEFFTSGGKKIYITIAGDLTERRRLLKLLEEKKEFEQSVLDAQASLVFVTDKDGKIRMANKRFLDFFRCSDAEDFEKRYSRLYYLFENERGFVSQKDGAEWFKKIFENPQKEYKTILKDADKSGRHIFLTRANVMSPEPLYVVTFSEITETVEAASALKDANSLLLMYSDRVKAEMKTNLELLTQQTKLATMGEMIGIITHQWKQPLNTVGLIAQNIEDIIDENEAISPEEIKSAMASIMKHIVTMGETVDNFRDFFKNHSQMRYFPFKKTLDSALQLCQPLMKKNGITVKCLFSGTAELLYLHGFPNEFKQVILNILINAKDALAARNKDAENPRGGFIEIISEGGRESIRITLRDNGTGFNDTDMDKLFDISYTTKGEGGTGIGMYMTKLIIEKMRGRIWPENWENGAAVVMELPAKQELNE